MDKLNKFLADHGVKIIIVLLALNYLKSCGTNSDCG
jgi:hypothetical protein